MTPTPLAPPPSHETPAAGASDHTPRMAYLDGWRGVSILLVLIGHFFHIRGVSVARLGVEFFFVLSGRLMAEILFVQKYPLPLFYRRRISRIVPALLFFALAMLLVPASLPAIAISWTDFWTTVTFTANYAQLILGEGEKSMGHIWSLCVEEHAYVLLATVAFFHRRHAFALPVVLGAIIALSVALGALGTYAFHQNHHAVYWRTDVRVASILIPVLTYLWLRGSEQRSAIAADPRWIAWRPAIAVGAGLALNVTLLPDFVKYSLGTFCLAYGVCTLDRAAPLIREILSFKALTLCGIWSFSLYLWQQPFFVLYLEGFASRWLLIPALFVPALFSFYLVENPVRAWLNRIWRAEPRRKGEAAANISGFASR